MEVFLVSPASPKPLWILGVVCIAISVVVLLLGYVAYSSRHARVELGADHIRLSGDLWGRRIPLSNLQPSSARVVNLASTPELSPARRTMGTGLPGYATGWFRLKSGEKALLYLTQRERVVYLPTTEGYSILLSLEEPERFLESLKRTAT